MLSISEEMTGIKKRSCRELSDLIHDNWEIVHHTIGTLLSPAVYAIGLHVFDIEDPIISAGEATGISVAGSFALYYTGMLVDFLIPEMRRESYIRKNQRNAVRTAVQGVVAGAAGTVLSYVTNVPFVYTALLTAASFIVGKTAVTKISPMNYAAAVPSVLFLASSLYMGIIQPAGSTTIPRENTSLQAETKTVAKPVLYEAEPPFTIWPVLSDRKQINSCFGYRRNTNPVVSRHHRGIDIQAGWHTPVVSVGNGMVTQVVSDGGVVQIDHGHGILTAYGHLDQIDVHVGDPVLGGQPIGLSGGASDGRNGPSTGPHLHFMVIDENVSARSQSKKDAAMLLNGKVNPFCYVDWSALEVTVSTTGSCRTQGGKAKYCDLYKDKEPKEVISDIKEQYRKIVRREVAMAFNPRIIYALIAQESKGEHDAGSREGAYGLLQFTPPTAFAYNLCNNKKCNGRDDRTDPEKSIVAGVAYYKALRQKFNDYSERDIFAIAAYNAGDEVIRKAIEQTNSPDPTWDQVAVMITSRLIGEVYNTRNERGNRRKAIEIKEHVKGVRGYYSLMKQ